MAVQIQNPFLVRRQELGLSQEQAAAACGVSLSCWQNYEKARSAPQRSKLQQISDGLNWSVEKVINASAWIHKQLLAAA